MTIAENLSEVLDRIGAACDRAGRERADVRLIAVGKTFPIERIQEACEAGAIDFGENRVQEGVDKATILPQARWHLIGPLQKNKVKQALSAFSLIHTVDRPDLAERMNRLMERDHPGESKEVLVEVNIGHEDQKAGVLPTDAAELVRLLGDLPSLRVRGLMAIPPYAQNPESSREYFAKLAGLRDRIQNELGLELPELSMGMSHDFEIAIAEGATMVRVGSAIFGPRQPRA